MRWTSESNLKDDVSQEEDGCCGGSSPNDSHSAGGALDPLLKLSEEGAADE